MPYVDARYDRDSDTVQVVERVDGKRVYTDFPAEYVFYYEDQRGRYKTMWGAPCVKVSTHSNKQFQKELKSQSGRKIHESDINPIFRCLENNYLNLPTPKLHVGFFDIEVDFDPARGFASPWDPFARITAISVYLTSVDKLVTLVLKPDLPSTHPDYLSWDAADQICNEFEDTMLCNDEEQMLSTFLDLVDDCDVLSGWNSTGFDIPYTINRIERIMGKDYSKKLCLWNQRPKVKEYTKFKKTQRTYELSGRIHIDYLELFQKHNPQQLHSYRLDYVGEIVVGENKVPYEGSLDSLYKKDFKKFIAYNRQDTLLLHKIDQNRRYIELANQLAHTNSVLLPTSMGSVALIEQAIINETHIRGMVVPTRVRTPKEYDSEGEEEEIGPAVGAYVADPKRGISEHIGCCDINSLYPSALRALNMGPETLVGQIRCDRTDAEIARRVKTGVSGPAAWHGIFNQLEFDIMHNRTDEKLVVDFEGGDTIELTGDELYQYIFDKANHYSISANGTIFRTDIEAVIPGLLAKWYSERKTMQARAKAWKGLTKGVKITDEFESAIAKGDFQDIGECDIGSLGKIIDEKSNTIQDISKVAQISCLIRTFDLHILNGKLIAKDITYAKTQEEFWDQRQQARKILLNSLYGALLNEGCRFYDQRIGQSVTLTGRSIARHMNSKINEIITGEYKVDGEAIIYADTDSSYFTVSPMFASNPDLKEVLENSKEQVIQLYDSIADETNDSFPGFMNQRFNTGLERGAIIKAGRELVGSRGLFITKKRYAILVYDKEGTRQDINGKPGSIKAMGLDLKRSDTPKMMQEFLESILMDVLNGATREDAIKRIKEFRQTFRSLDPWFKGTPKKVNNLTDYAARQAGGGKNNMFKDLKGKGDKKANAMIPGHVLASINWNKLRHMYNDNYSMEIQDGQKIIVCRLKSNPLNMDSIAYPIDENRLPAWFKALPFDEDKMEDTIIDMKIGNLLEVLKWDLRDAKDDSTFGDLFNF